MLILTHLVWNWNAQSTLELKRIYSTILSWRKPWFTWSLGGAFKGLKSITTFELSTLYLLGGFCWLSKNLLVEGALERKDQCLDNHYMTLWSNEDLPNAVADYWWPMLALVCHNTAAPYQTTSDGLIIYIYQHLHKYYTIVTHSNIHMSHRTGSHASTGSHTILD